MPHVSYVNGRYVPHDEAVVHMDDRGFQFADSVYDVVPVVAGRMRLVDQHLDRLGRSLAALAVGWPVARRALPVIMARIMRRNWVNDGVIYIQVTRGVAPRNHPFPSSAVPSLVVSAWNNAGPAARLVEEGVRVVTRPDERWGRPDIKTTGLLANVLARQSAKENGAYEAWLIDRSRHVTEGCSSNVFILARDGALLTHPDNGAILPGITRANVIRMARGLGLEVGERAFTLDEARAARETFLTGTTITVLPVVTVDDAAIGDGKPGPVTMKLRALYQDYRRND